MQQCSPAHVTAPVQGGDTRPSQGYGIALVAETDAGRFISAERCVSGAALLRAREAQVTAADTGEQAACMLLDEIKRCARVWTACSTKCRSDHTTCHVAAVRVARC